MRVTWFGGPLDGQTESIANGVTHLAWSEITYHNEDDGKDTKTMTVEDYEARIYSHPVTGAKIVNYHYRQRIDA